MLNPEAKLNRRGFANIIAVIIALVVLAGAIAGYLAVKKRTPATTEAPVVTAPVGQDVITDETVEWKTYRNEKYGFEFKYPADHTVYGDIDVAREVLIPATPTSDHVAIAEREAHVFCCEPITLEFSAPFYHPEEFPSYERKNITFAGRDAVEIIGPGTIDSFYKVIRVNSPPDGNNESFKITITQKSQSELLDKILSTFKFTK